MRRYIVFTLLLTSFIFLLIQCKKQDNTPQYSVDDFLPALEFIIEPGYLYQDTFLGSSSMFQVGVIANMNSLSGASLESFSVIKSIKGEEQIVYEQTEMNETSIYWSHIDSVSVIPGDEIWRFLIRDSHWHMNSLSFKISTDGGVEYFPSIQFIEGLGFVSNDTTLKTNAWFWWEVSTKKSVAEETPLSYFEAVRIFDGIQTIVWQYSLPGNSSDYGFSKSVIANAEAGDELWIFTIRDEANRTDTVSFIITTETVVYCPTFLTDYQIVNPQGFEKLDFFHTCSTDDWEMSSCMVRYPNNLKCEMYYGNGEVIAKGNPYSLANEFINFDGRWEFTINGIIRSGQYDGIEFTVYTSVDVP